MQQSDLQRPLLSFLEHVPGMMSHKGIFWHFVDNGDVETPTTSALLNPWIHPGISDVISKTRFEQIFRVLYMTDDNSLVKRIGHPQHCRLY